MERKSWQELELTGHIVYPDRSRGRQTLVFKISFSLIKSTTLAHRMSFPILRISLSTLINLIQTIFHRHSQRFVYMVIVNLIELFLKVNNQIRGRPMETLFFYIQGIQMLQS